MPDTQTIHIDGSLGEGGGQVLRSALTLSLVTGCPFALRNIRARRAKPGLMPQHLKAVQAAAAVGRAAVEGAQLGSQFLRFTPQGVARGDYRFDIGTAGSAPLVLQTVLLPLCLADGPSHVTVTGGTHVPWSPCFHYLDLHWLRFMKRIGFQARLTMDAAGFYPPGGGCIHAAVQPVKELCALRLTRRGALRRIRGISAVANLDPSIAQRQRAQAVRRLQHLCCEIDIELVAMPAHSRGTVLLLIAEFEHSQCCYFALGERGKPAERVADEAVDGLDAFLAGDGAVDKHLADQLLLPLALAAGHSELRTASVTPHLLTNAEVVRAFLPREILIQGEPGEAGVLNIAAG